MGTEVITFNYIVTVALIAVCLIFDHDPSVFIASALVISAMSPARKPKP